MKTKRFWFLSSVIHHQSPLGQRLLLCLGLVVVAGAVIGAVPHKPGNLVAHEWGTFTSVQGGDGVLLDWRPLETSKLPGFVYDWKRPGLNRTASGPQFPGKFAMITLQRMETPVIYFYADQPQTVDVSVDFPKGFITEWYPQASQIGPASVPVSPTIAKMDECAHKVGAKPSFTFASFFDRPVYKESRIHWSDIEILPQKDGQSGAAPALPFDRSGSHYFAARETDSAYLKASSLAATNPVPEHEKFIFYRGVGNFATPLRVTMNSSNVVTLVNTGTEPLEHLFVLSLENRAGSFTEIPQLMPGQERTVEINPEARLKEVSDIVIPRMADALVHEGLYRREATAMVNTWKDSWFAEDGVRVLYTLPRAWTDRTLPLKLHPEPRDLVRVMVGRAEILSPALEQKLTDSLTKASQGDGAARGEAQAEFKKLGRFAEPAVRLATQGFNAETTQLAWRLVQPPSAFE